MHSVKKIALQLLSLVSALPVFGGEPKIVQANGIEISYETFGKKEDPALLLIMGGCNPGILWPEEFCERLAKEDFYVIRYDHRDTGFSSCFDFEKNPYDLKDMAKDAIGLLDALNIEQAHLFGLSMGGPIAELMAVRFPERVHTITLMATSCDMRDTSAFYEDMPAIEGFLSGPKEIYISWMKEFIKNPPETFEDKLEQRLVGWRILCGCGPFDEESYRKIHTEFLKTLRHPQGIVNHLLAIKRSEDDIRIVPYQVRVPTLVLHGTEDPIFPPDHGDSLANAIYDARYVLVDGMGHVPSSQYYDLMIREIKEHCYRK